MQAAESHPQSRPRRRDAWKLYLLIFVCVAPVIASYLAYYVFPPAGRSNYGTLIEPQRPLPEIASTLVHPRPDTSATQPAVQPGGAMPEIGGLGSLKGRWILIAIDKGACELACAEKLFFMRQTHAAMGKDRDRMVRVLLVVDETPLPAPVLTAHPDLVVLRVPQGGLDQLFPVPAGSVLADHIYVVDPLHNLMMRFPEKPDPSKTRKDLQKLLKASRIG